MRTNTNRQLLNKTRERERKGEADRQRHLIIIIILVYKQGESAVHCCHLILTPTLNRLAGLVVKASASGEEGPGFDSRLRRDFSEVESYQ